MPALFKSNNPLFSGSFFSKIKLLKNQVSLAKQGLPIKNFINPKNLLLREKELLKIYLKKINELKTRAKADISEEYF